MSVEASVSFLEKLMGSFGVMGIFFNKKHTSAFIPSKLRVLGLSLPYKHIQKLAARKGT
jgi:hypothetical protein